MTAETQQNSKPGPTVIAPRVVVEMQAYGAEVEQVKQFGDVLCQIAGLEGRRAVQWMADAVDAANRCVIGLKESKGRVKLAPNTVLRAVKNAAGMGLSFNPTLGQLYLVPFKNTALSKRYGEDTYDCQLIVGYQGYEALAYGLGWMDALFVEVVLAEELEEGATRFDYWHDESGPHILHRPKLPRSVPRDLLNGQQEIAIGYASWRTTRGTVGVAVADKGRIARAFGKAGKYSDMWRFDFPAGVKKTAIREAAKHWKKSRLLSSALMLDDQVEIDAPQADITGVRIPEIDESNQPSGPAPGDVAGLGEDDADDSPAYRALLRRVEGETDEKFADLRSSVEEAAELGSIDDRQRGALLERLAEVEATIPY